MLVFQNNLLKYSMDVLGVLYFVLAAWGCFVLNCCHTLNVVYFAFHFDIKAAGRYLKYFTMSKFLRSLAQKENLGLVRPVVFMFACFSRDQSYLFWSLDEHGGHLLTIIIVDKILSSHNKTLIGLNILKDAFH